MMERFSNICLINNLPTSNSESAPSVSVRDTDDIAADEVIGNFFQKTVDYIDFIREAK